MAGSVDDRVGIHFQHLPSTAAECDVLSPTNPLLSMGSLNAAVVMPLGTMAPPLVRPVKSNRLEERRDRRREAVELLLMFFTASGG